MKKILTILILVLVVSVGINFYFASQAVNAREEAKKLATEREVFKEAFRNLYVYHRKEIPKAKTFAIFALSEAYSRVMAEEKKLSPEAQFKLIETEGLEFTKRQFPKFFE